MYIISVLLALLTPFSVFCTLTISLLGDSNTYGFPRQERGWAGLLKKEFVEYKIVNRGGCGASSLLIEKQLQRALEEDHPDIIILNAGLVDIWMGASTYSLKNCLERMIRLAINSNVKILFGKIELHHWQHYNLKPLQYYQEMSQVYTDLSIKYPVISYDYITGEILNDKRYRLDHLHPNAAGHQKIYEVIRENLLKVL